MQTKDILHLLPCFLHACDCQFFMYISTPTPYFHSFYSTYAAIGSSFLVDAVTSKDMDRSLYLLSHAYIAWLHECHVTACSYRLRKLHDSASWRLLEIGFLCTVKYLCIVQAKPVLLRFICYIAPSVEG